MIRPPPPSLVRAPWRDPAQVACAFAEEPFALALLSDGRPGARWSYLARAPAQTFIAVPQDGSDILGELRAALGLPRSLHPGGPPFQGGLAGLACYELGERIDPMGLARRAGWPDLACGLYEQVLAFDHVRQEVLAIGPDAARAEQTLAWMEAKPAASASPFAAGPLQAPAPSIHARAVAAVMDRIAAGEIFQANVARAWRGVLAPRSHPFDLAARLARTSPAPYAAYLRLPRLALVSNSPERFLSVRPAAGGLVAETRPIKGTTPRGGDPALDARLAAALAASEKDRAENLMIVDLMRNDLARVSRPGSVRVPALFDVERFANVSHLVSTITADLTADASALDLFAAAFPPGSVTGAPKRQAMKVIADYEAPRGPFFGSLFWAGFDGAFDSSVLIRAVAFEMTAEGWALEARAGGGIVADSDPQAEVAETDAKIAAILGALTATEENRIDVLRVEAG